jgi:hypothetical protein
VGGQSASDAAQELLRVWPVERVMPLLLVPLTGGLGFDPGSAIARWLERTVRELVELRLTEDVYRGRLARLQDALSLSAYNAGMGNLSKSAKRKDPLGGMSFPLELSENRDYVDSILDGAEVLSDLEPLLSGVSHMGLEELSSLTEQACGLSGIAPADQK